MLGHKFSYLRFSVQRGSKSNWKLGELFVTFGLPLKISLISPSVLWHMYLLQKVNSIVPSQCPIMYVIKTTGKMSLAQVDSFKYLGICVDPSLTYSKLVYYVFYTVGPVLGALYKNTCCSVL